ncbi:ribonuclease H-like domain-containing protein [Mycena haematopus]|nr:ribonuclease H-like domain-containing protein [Mycena haematopus]
MPAPLGPVWEFFYPGGKQNSSHNAAYCLGCIRHARQVHGFQDPPNETDTTLLERIRTDTAAFSQALDSTDHVRGVKKSMLAHLIGRDPCPHISAETKKKAKALKNSTPLAADSDADNDSDPQPAPKKRKAVFRNVEKAMRQPELTVYRGANIPFSSSELERVRAQFLRATVSANLPFRWTEDVEVIKLFIMFRALACDAIPSRDVLSGTLLNKASIEVEKALRTALKLKYVVLSSDGWKDDQRNPITGVNVSANGKSYLIDLIQSNGHKKDGASMCLAFEVILFCCDNDGGSLRGRKDLNLKRPWLIIAPCCAHQGELMLGDYLSVNERAADVAEQATDLIHWIIGHDRVRKIFDDAQFEKNFKIVAYLLANLTRWTTHYLAFQRLLHLKTPLRYAAFLYRNEIIAAQVGAEKNRKAVDKMADAATAQIDLIESNEFWTSLQTVVDDIEPLCYATNINQSDRTRPDQVLLTFAGLYRHFSAHPNRAVAKGMTARIEKRWAALDQPFFVLCLVLNPYEALSRFGDKAGTNVFVLNTELVALFHRVRSRPIDPPRRKEEDDAREKALSIAFMNYLQGTGDFASFYSNGNKEAFEKQHPDDPRLVWEQFKRCDGPGVRDLASFAMMLLGLAVNQAATERSFSDLKIKKTRLRNRLGTQKLEKMSKFGASIRSENLQAGLIHKREAREVHDPTTVSGLLSVPRYADAIEAGDDEDGVQSSKLVKSGAAWRAEVAKWVKAARDDEEAGIPAEEPVPAANPTRPRKFFPRSLDLLFGGEVTKPVGKPRREQFTEEVLMMELLAAEESDEEPDDGELSGSGDDFEL